MIGGSRSSGWCIADNELADVGECVDPGRLCSVSQNGRQGSFAFAALSRERWQGAGYAGCGAREACAVRRAAARVHYAIARDMERARRAGCGTQGAKRSRRAAVSRRKQAFTGLVTIIRRPCKGLLDGYGDVRWLCLYNGSVNNLTTSDLDYIFQNIEMSLSASGESALTPISRKASQPSDKLRKRGSA